MKSLPLLCLLATSLAAPASAREWFVRQPAPGTTGPAAAPPDGSPTHPFPTLNAAAQLAQPGDVVTVAPGVYHEWVSPARGGSPSAPILYRSVPPHAAVVRGTDRLDAPWQPAEGAPGVFSAPLPQSAFVFGNPFLRPPRPTKKQPEWTAKCDALVFLDDRPLTQATTREQLLDTPDTWLSTDDGQQLLVHLQRNAAPAKGSIEITTRDRIFAPHRRGLGYIHVDGFVFERCAARPGWPQLGALSTRTGQHWVIRHNVVRDTTGKGIDCGSETWSPESMIATEKEDKRILIGGHHLVEHNLLTNNAECGIAAWNTESVRILDNVVRNNAARGAEQPINFLADAEAAGIKVHAFRHGLIEHNLVTANASFGIWLDNGWEDARVTRNLCTDNRGAGIFVELGFGPALIDHNLSANNTPLWPPYLGDGIYTHDASDLTITHNTLSGNARDGLHQLVVSERAYANRRLCEASDETITANLFHDNHHAAISLPLDSPRSRFNHSDDNVFDPTTTFEINDNERRIPIQDILKSCRLQLDAAHVPKDQQPDLSDPKRLPTLSLPAWRVVMQTDHNSKPTPADLHITLHQTPDQLTIDLPPLTAIPTVPPGPADDTDLLGQPIDKAAPRAGAIQLLHPGTQTITLWPLPPTTHPTPATAPSPK